MDSTAIVGKIFGTSEYLTTCVEHVFHCAVIMHCDKIFSDGFMTAINEFKANLAIKKACYLF